MLRSEINRWDNNHIDVSMLVSTNCKMRKDLQELQRELQKWKDKCEDLGQDNLRLRNKIAEAQAEDEEIEQLYGNVANGIETRHMEGNDDEEVHEAINFNIMDTDTVDTKQLIIDNVTIGGIISLEQSDDQLIRIAKQTKGVTENIHG